MNDMNDLTEEEKRQLRQRIGLAMMGEGSGKSKAAAMMRARIGFMEDRKEKSALEELRKMQAEQIRQQIEDAKVDRENKAVETSVRQRGLVNVERMGAEMAGADRGLFSMAAPSVPGDANAPGLAYHPAYQKPKTLSDAIDIYMRSQVPELIKDAMQHKMGMERDAAKDSGREDLKPKYTQKTIKVGNEDIPYWEDARGMYPPVFRPDYGQTQRLGNERAMTEALGSLDDTAPAAAPQSGSGRSMMDTISQYLPAMLRPKVEGGGPEMPRAGLGMTGMIDRYVVAASDAMQKGDKNGLRSALNALRAYRTGDPNEEEVRKRYVMMFENALKGL